MKKRNEMEATPANLQVIHTSALQQAVSNRWTGLWTGSVDWITGFNQTASKSDDACVAH